MQAKEPRRTSEGRARQGGWAPGWLLCSKRSGPRRHPVRRRVLGSSPGPWPLAPALHPPPAWGNLGPAPRFWSRLLTPISSTPPQPSSSAPSALAPPPYCACALATICSGGGACTGASMAHGPAHLCPGPASRKALVRLGLSIKIRMVVGFHGVWQLLSRFSRVRLCATP